MTSFFSLVCFVLFFSILYFVISSEAGVTMVSISADIDPGGTNMLTFTFCQNKYDIRSHPPGINLVSKHDPLLLKQSTYNYYCRETQEQIAKGFKLADPR